MEAYLQYCIAVGVTVLGIILVKGVSLVFRLTEFKINPNAEKKTTDLPEGAFRQLKKKKVLVKLKSGEIISGCRYMQTIFFAEGDFAMNYNVFFQLESGDGNLMFISGLDISRIETEKEG